MHIKIYKYHNLQDELRINNEKLELVSILEMIVGSLIHKNEKIAQINDPMLGGYYGRKYRDIINYVRTSTEKICINTLPSLFVAAQNACCASQAEKLLKN